MTCLANGVFVIGWSWKGDDERDDGMNASLEEIISSAASATFPISDRWAMI